MALPLVSRVPSTSKVPYRGRVLEDLTIYMNPLESPLFIRAYSDPRDTDNLVLLVVDDNDGDRSNWV